MEALTLQNSTSAAVSFARRGETCAPITVHCRMGMRKTCFFASLGCRTSFPQTRQTCGSFSSESAAASQPELSGTQYEEGVNLDESISLLKKAAKTRKVASTEVLAALCAIEKAKVDPSSFLATIGGSPEAPGPRTWMLVYTSSKEEVSETFKGGTGKGSYFPITAIQTFDATALTIENGAYLGPLGGLSFEGRMSWNGRILAFLFDSVGIKIGSFGPFKFNIAKKEDLDRAPTNKDPFFVWHYADEEIIVARGRGGGLAFWCRCAKVRS